MSSGRNEAPARLRIGPGRAHPLARQTKDNHMETTTASRGLKLYQIPEVYRELLDRAADPETGELDAALEMELEGLIEEFDRKVEWIALLCREAKAEAAAVKMEEDRLSTRRRVCENRETRLKKYIHDCMTRAGIQRVDGRAVKVKIQANSQPSIEWTLDEALIPAAFQVVTVRPNLTLARDELKAGSVLPDGFKVTSGSHVRVL